MIDWKKVRYLKIPWQATDEEADWLYELWLNEPLASWDVFAKWELERVLSMRKHLIKGEILFDIGTESGWCNLVYAKIVGPENMVLVEPTPEFWHNIKALWQKNFLSTNPLGCYSGFFSDVTTDTHTSELVKPASIFPIDSNGPLIEKNAYKYIHTHADQIPQITLDKYVETTGNKPDALTIDVEGAELLVLKGAKNTLKNNNVKVWVSEHDDMAQRDYGVKPGKIAAFMKSLGYQREFLAKDHEVHAYYSK